MQRIKESFDRLPIGICFFDRHGVVRLINHRMLEISGVLCKGGLQTLPELQAALQAPPEAVSCLDPALSIYRFPNGIFLRFSEERLTLKAGGSCTQVTAADVTELIHGQDRLRQENERLADANSRARRLLAQMPEIIRQEETLAMKMRVHDDIGHSILSARRALVGEESLDTIRRSAAEWEQSIAVLYRTSRISNEREALEQAIFRASELDVRIVWKGAEPTVARELLALAVRECAMNCVKHAGGTALTVSCTRENGCIHAALTNDGTPPERPIEEGGGLSMLRHRVEAAGGRMEIESLPRFVLLLSLPEKEEIHHASDDR